MTSHGLLAVGAGIAAIAALAWMIDATRRQRRRVVPEAQLAWLAWHWVTGGEMTGSRSYLARGVWSRIVLAAVRVISTITVGWVILIGAGNSSATFADSAVLAGQILAIAAVAAHLAARSYMWVHWARPLGNAVGKAASWPDRMVTEWMVRLPRDLDRARRGPRIRMGWDFEPRQGACDRVEEICRQVLGMHDAEATWRVTGWRNHLSFTPARVLPDRVPWSDPDVREIAMATPPSAPLLGLTRDAAPVTRDLDSDAPHVIISTTTGAGKSSILRSIIAQVMWHDPDSEVLIIDAKRHSHLWIRGIAGVTYARDPQDIHDALVAAGEEGRARNRACDDLPLGAEMPFPRKLIVCEELNGTMTWLQNWWATHRQPSDPKISPAVQALREILFMGRAVRIHVLGAAQQATARALGGGEARENFALRILAGYSANTWKMLTPDCNYVPARRHHGWAMVCYGTVATETQMVWITDTEARDFVLEKRPLSVSNGRCSTYGRNLGELGNRTLSSTHSNDEYYSEDDDPIELVTLSEAVERDILECTLTAANRARAQDPEFPASVTGGGKGTVAKYWVDALTRWERNRPRASNPAHEPIVYFLRPGSGQDVKIGTTTNLDRRLKALALHPDDVACTVPGGQDVEREFHRRWADLRIHDDREWFRCEGELAAWLSQQTRTSITS
jgi:hypothetical protein